MLTLQMEREGESKTIATVPDMKKAIDKIDSMEICGEWPEGWDAIIVSPSGTRWLYTDQLEEITDH